MEKLEKAYGKSNIVESFRETLVLVAYNAWKVLFLVEVFHRAAQVTD